MIKNIKNTFTKCLLALALLFVVAGVVAPAPSVAAATAESAVCESIGATSGGGKNCSTPGRSVNDVVKAAINIISIVAGIIAVIMLIVAGLKYILSSGDPTNITSAKNTLIYAIVGLVVVALAQFIVRFVLSEAI